MLLAWWHPQIEACWKLVDKMAPANRLATRVAIVSVTLFLASQWYLKVYCLPKLEYNAMHPYTSWIPLTLWVVLRNMTPALRSHSLGLFGWLGCITLETYIGQFHIWLRSNIPDGQPKWVLNLVRFAVFDSEDRPVGVQLIVLQHCVLALKCVLCTQFPRFSWLVAVNTLEALHFKKGQCS
jgi:hypothetical protein